MAEFDLKGIYKRAFGVDVPEGDFVVPADNAHNEVSLFTLAKKDARQQASLLGGMYYDKDVLGRELFLPVKLEGYVLPFSVVSVTAKKTIVSTAMPERGGSVKELISIDDYSINIKGIVMTDNGQYPDFLIKDIHGLFLENRALTMDCVLTNIFLKRGQKVVVTACKWPAVAGVEHARPFELELESDEINDLIVVA